MTVVRWWHTASGTATTGDIDRPSTFYVRYDPRYWPIACPVGVDAGDKMVEVERA